MSFNLFNDFTNYSQKTQKINKNLSVNNTNAYTFLDKKIQDKYVSTADNKSELKTTFEKIKKQQGIIGKAWDGFKNVFKMKSGSKQVEKLIALAEKDENYKEKAKQAIEKYNEGQKTCVDVVADIVSGILSLGAFCLAVPTGGSSLMAGLAVATLTGAGIKIGIKGADSLATGKEYNKKNLTYDFATGALNGVMAPITNGLGNCVTKTIGKKFGLKIFEQGARQTAQQGLKSVILTKSVDVAGGNVAKRAISLGAGMALDGALGGASDNALRAGLNKENVFKAAIQGAIGGLILSPIIGGSFRMISKAASKVTKNISSNTPDAAATPRDTGSPTGAHSSDVQPTKGSGIDLDDTPQTHTGKKHNSLPPDYDTTNNTNKTNYSTKDNNYIGTKKNSLNGDGTNKIGVDLDENGSDGTHVNTNNPGQTPEANAQKKGSSVDTQASKNEPPAKSKHANAGIEKKIKELQANGNSKIREFSVNGKKTNFEVFLGTQSGSNTGYYALNQTTGELFYAKIGGHQSQAEVLASRIYKAAGIDVPELTHFTAPNGEKGILSKYIPNLNPIKTPNSLLYDGFGMDVLLANWDAVCSNNAVSDGTKAIRIDLGGTFDFRAQGAKKPFTSIADEITTLVNPSKNKVSANIFGNMTREELISSLKKVADLDDTVIEKLLKDEGLEKYTQTLLKRKEFLSDLLEQVEKTSDNGEDLFTYLTKIKNQTFNVTIAKTKTLKEINEIQDSINHIQDINIKKKLQSQLDQKKAEITQIASFAPKQIDAVTLEGILSKSGLITTNANGKYVLVISQDLKDEILSRYDSAQGNLILKKLQKPISKSSLNEMVKILNACNGKYIDYFTNNLTDFIALYQIMDSCSVLMYHLKDITSGQWEAIFNSVLHKAPKDVIEALSSYKMSSSDINSALTAMKNAAQGQKLKKPIPQYVQDQIKVITDYIDTQTLNEGMTVYRREDLEVLNSIIINGKELSQLMTDCAGDPKKISQLIDVVEQGNYVATQERFMSTSLREDATLYGCILWELDLPAGTKGVFLEGLNVKGDLASECEFLLQRNSKIRIKKINYDKSKGIWRIKAEIKN